MPIENEGNSVSILRRNDELIEKVRESPPIIPMAVTDLKFIPKNIIPKRRDFFGRPVDGRGITGLSEVRFAAVLEPTSYSNI